MRYRRGKGLKVPRLGQVGVIVKDIDETIDYYENVFGIGPWAVFLGEPVMCVEAGGQIDFKGKIAMAQAGTVQIELIQILEGRSAHSEFLNRSGEGIHHVGFFVNDISERIRAAKEAGIEIIQHGLLKQLGVSIEYVYLDTTASGGVIMEFIQPRFLGMPFPMKTPLLRVGASIYEKYQRLGFK
jgi:catechol 2,3-dioxygenase-like lactoylglutathione lyase family enzyme